MRAAFFLLAFLAASPAATQPPAPLQPRIEAMLAESAPAARFGLLVVGEDGREIVSVAADRRFVPASNTKLFTTAAAFARLPALDRADTAGGATVRIDRRGPDLPDVILEGRGDARLSSRPGCLENCLSALADAVARETRRVRHVVGDSSLFPDERWSPGMSWNNMATYSGTAVSALTLDDNELALRVLPAAAGKPPRVEGLAYYPLVNVAVTTASGPETLSVFRLPGSAALRLAGTIPANGGEVTLRLGIDDPAYYAAWRLKALLEERGVRVEGFVRARHRPPGSALERRSHAALLSLAPRPLLEDISTINKSSQNVHAELLLRRLGLIAGEGSIADGLAVVNSVADAAEVADAGIDLSDGSGMSTYNRLSPRGVVALLRWAAAQPWAAQWRSSLAVAGVDGTLENRFRGTPLEGRLFAKTGSLNATTALSGYLVARSGRTLTFSAFANDAPDSRSAAEAIDAALLLIAAER